MRLKGKVALVTGAATGLEGELMGFGGTIARLFAREGARVTLSDIDDESGRKTAAQITDAGGETMFVRADVTREADWVDVIEATTSRFGRLDILVNNAGILSDGRLEDTTEEIWYTQMDVHAKGTFLGTKHAIAPMREAGGGSIVNISSIAGMLGGPAGAAYSASKGAIRTFTKAAAVQYAKDKIRVNSVHGGSMLSPLAYPAYSTPEARQRVESRVPLGRLGTADDIAYGALFLASDEASYVTGAELVIDGGLIAQ